jgi:signal transduction histidine kinase
VFKNLRTGTKLIILCATFIVAIGVTILGLIVEKRAAIDFARKELAGNRYLMKLRDVYAGILAVPATDAAGVRPLISSDQALALLATAQTDAAGLLQTADLQRALAATLRELWSKKWEDETTDAFVLAALAGGRTLASRVGDDSNLSLDPDLDSYYLQDVVVRDVPILLGHLAEMQMLVRASGRPGQGDRTVRFLVLDGLVRSTLEGTRRHLAAAYRGNSDGSLKPSIEGEFATMTSNAERFLGALRARMPDRDGAGGDTGSVDAAYAAAATSALGAWASAQAALDRLLHRRIDNLVGRMGFSLALTGAFAALSIVIAVMTHRHIVQPLERLEQIASTVRESKNYDLRINYTSRDEIGQLASAFDDMMSELAAARERDLAKQAELARVTRLTTMGQMAASIAHEINQPLAAIVTGSSAGLRWLGRAAPDLDEVRATLQRINNDGHRASDVIASVRAMFKKEGQGRAPIDVNDLIREVLVLVNGDLRKRKISVRTELAERLPPILADHVQLQQVMLNLVTNAADAMAPVTDRTRLLQIRSTLDGSDGVNIVVQDSGTGIDADARERMFDAFFTTKSNGMGLGLSICRSIVEAHGGRLCASPATPHGSMLQLMLPVHGPGGAS